MNRYALRTGEYLAISSDAIRRDADGFFLMLSGAPPENETRGSVVLVNVRGALQQFASPFGDSYESIVERVGKAFASDPKPSAVVLRISSPGGVVAGLSETTAKLQRMSKEAGIPLLAYVDELAASAAYHLCCACSEVLSPPSGVSGSIGVISTMVSIAKHDEQEGIEFRIITSGKRKADGHLHAPLTDDAVKAETARNTELAAQFFGVVSKARGIPVKKIQGLEAAIYLGKDAQRVGLVDDVLSLDEALLGLNTSEVASTSEPAPNDGNVTDRRAQPKKVDAATESRATQNSNAARSDEPGEDAMGVRLQAVLKTAAAIAAEKDPTKLATLQASLAALVKAGGDDDDDDGPPKKKDDDDDGDDDESKAKKAAAAARKAKGKAEAAKHRAKAAEHKAKAAESEEEAKKCEEEAEGGEEDDEDDEAHLRTPPAQALTPGAAAALASQSEMGAQALARVEKLEKAAEARDLASLINDARASRRITPGEAKTLGKKSAGFVRDFLEMRPKPLVATDEEMLSQPDGTPEGDVPANVKAIIDQGIEAQGLTGEKADAYRKASVDAHRKAMSKTNGVY